MRQILDQMATQLREVRRANGITDHYEAFPTGARPPPTPLHAMTIHQPLFPQLNPGPARVKLQPLRGVTSTAFDAFRNRVMDFAALNGYGDALVISSLSQYIEGEAQERTTHVAHRPGDNLEQHLDRLKAALVPPARTAAAATSLQNIRMRDDETPYDYIRRGISLWMQAYPGQDYQDNRDFISRLIRGFPIGMSLDLCRLPIGSVQQLETAASNLANMQETKRAQLAELRNSKNQHRLSQMDRAPPTPRPTGATSAKGPPFGRPRPSAPGPGRPCFHCDSTDHWAKECPKRSSRARPSLSQVTPDFDPEEDPYLEELAALEDTYVDDQGN